MTKVKFHIASQTELVLDQDAHAGDVIDLTDEQNIDTSIVNGKIADILEDKLTQARTEWFKQQEKQAAVELENHLQAQKQTMQAELNEKAQQIVALETKLDNLMQQNAAELQSQLVQKELAVQDTLAKKDAEIAQLVAKIDAAKQQGQAELETALVKKDAAVQAELATKDKKLAELTSQLELKEQKQQLELTNVQN